MKSNILYEKVLLQIISKKDGIITLGYANTNEPCIRLHTKDNWDEIPVGQCAFIPLNFIPKPNCSNVSDIIDKYVNAKS